MKKLLPFISSLVYLLFGQTERAYAQSDPFGSESLNSLSIATGGSKDIFEIITNIVNIVLYFLGGIAVLLGLYAGWLWFTSRGNSEQIKKAKGIMVSAVIGLVIIFASYAIVNFVVDTLIEAIEPAPSGGSSGGGSTIEACAPPTSSDIMVICGFSASKPVGGYVTVSGWNFGPYDTVATSLVNIGGTNAELVSCASTPYWKQRHTRNGSTYFQVKAIVPDIAPSVPQVIRVDNTVGGTPRFDTIPGYVVSTEALGLNIACFTPDEGPANTTIVTAQGINFGDAVDGHINMTGWDTTSAAATQIDVPFDVADWSNTGATFTIPNEALSSYVNISNDAVAAGAPDSEFFKVTCADVSGCTSGCCSRSRECRPLNICSSSSSVTTGPHINYLSPDNGREDNLITIQGSGFGTLVGTVSFGTLTGQLPSLINPICSDLWTDTEIIIGVPAVVAGNTYRVTVTPAGATEPSNGVTFRANTTVRPGICSADRNTGSYGTPVAITGVNFTDDPSDTVKFGGFDGGSLDIDTGDDIATSTVPNLSKGSVGIQINSGTEVSNPYTFAVTEVIAGDPNIVSITPETGPAGTYLTINGTSFGNSKGTTGNVFFGTTAADFNFPLMCSGSVWSSSRILVKVPTGLTNGTDYDVQVIRSDAKVSNTKPFTASAGTPGPGICAIFPNNGPRDTLVDFFGDNFGTVAGQVKFYNNKNATADVWTNNSALDAPVPAGTETGPVVVTNSDGVDSNAFNFRVGACSNNTDCDSGETCCENTIGNYCSATTCTNTRMCSYGWSFTTVPTPVEALRVDDHWPACDSACGNSAIGVGFNMLLDEATAENIDNYTITDITDTALPVTVNINFVTLTQNLSDPSPTPARIDIDYDDPLTLNHRYAVEVGRPINPDNIRNLAGTEELLAVYYWEFTVGVALCRFTNIQITPANFTARSPRQKISYIAMPTVDMGLCGVMPLTCPGCTYNWTLDPALDIATIISGANTKRMVAQSTNNDVPLSLVGTNNLQCEISQGVSTVAIADPAASLSYNYTDFFGGLRLRDYFPKCDGACLNSLVSLRFSGQLNDTSVANITSGSYVQIRDITTGAPIIGTITITNDPASESLINIRNIPFVAGNRYQVTVSNQIIDVLGNAFDGFFWQFTVGTEECAVTDAVVLPAVKLSAVGKNITYTAQTESDTIACGRTPVNCTSCTYDWLSTNDTVATIVGTGRVTAPATTVARGDAFIRCTVLQTARPNIIATPGTLTVTAPVYPIPEIEDHNPKMPALNQCLNMAIEILFTEKMNTESIKNNLKLFRVPPLGTEVQIDGTFAFATVDGREYPDRTKNQTKVIFSPNALLDASSNYRIELGTGIVSTYDMALDLITPDLSAWTFRTGAEICSVSYVTTEPDKDYFTCGGNDCEYDDQPAVSGNQHIYEATAYSRYGTILSDVGMTYTWRANPTTPNIVSFDWAAPLSRGQTYATAGENGTASASVTASLNIAGTSYGSASASLPVTVFLCQSPWPTMSNFPWLESASIDPENLNFSTYYCQQFTDTSQSLPYLNYPPRTTNSTSNPDIASGKILAEYIFTVNISGTTSKNNSLGSLAYYLPKSFDKKPAVWERLSALIPINQAHGQAVSVDFTIPANINMAVNGNDVTVTWEAPRRGWGDTTDFSIQRKLSSDSDTDWADIETYSVSTLTTSYIDDNVSNGRYDYRIRACANSIAVPYCSTAALHTFEINVSATSETNFIIFRVMPNPGHLSVKEWYKDKFPGDAVGTMTTVDGYEAMRVGNTIYISAANISGGSIYTNIYIVAYSVGANAQTKDIYDQFVANFKLNTNPGFSTFKDDNLCFPAESTGDRRECSSDLDCQTGATCFSKSLKLRRDVKRVTDLLPVQKYLATYGATHRACSHNGQISCTTDSDCGTGTNTCVNYYPQLNAGTFQIGKSNSKWPSWQQTLATDLRQTLPVDPINKFVAAGCPGADPETCWNEADRTFACWDTSYVYAYLLENFGKDYEIYSNFEYDPISIGPRFDINLVNGGTSYGVNNLGNISTNLSGYCSAASVPPGTNLCGNGVLNAGETCDGGINYGWCSDPLAGLGDHPWWNDQVTGCNPPGTPGQCQWYVPTGLTPAMCGGYCGDDLLQTRYESCDISGTGTLLSNGVYHCPTAVADVFVRPTLTTSCTNSCSMRCADTLPAAKCGDNVWTSLREACDTTGNPNGLADWDCTLGGNVMCGTPTNTRACEIYCDIGVPYRGSCGDRVIQSPELCDPGAYTTPLPADSIDTHRYTCSANCDFIGKQYCGDTILQVPFKEQCDTNPLAPILPIASNKYKQYACRMSNDVATDAKFTRCTLTTGGWCGDGAPQTAEQCDPLGYSVDPSASDITHQYTCTTACQTTGGYCGNGTVDILEEDCDGSIGLSNWGCTEGGAISCVSCRRTCSSGVPYAGQCGNSIVEAPEQCDGANGLAGWSCFPPSGGAASCVVANIANACERSCSSGELYEGQCGNSIVEAPEQCDPGVLPEKKVELVFVFDTSGSMSNAFDDLCTALTGPGGIISDPGSLPNTEFKITAMRLGTAFSCPAFGGIFPNVNGLATYDQSGDSFRSLLFYNEENYISDIVGLTGADDSFTLNYCAPDQGLENWGWATKKIIESYQWQDGYQRIIMPVSDEYAWCGGAVLSAPNPNEDFIGTVTDDIFIAVKEAANDTSSGRPKTKISPVILSRNGTSGAATTNADGLINQTLGEALAVQTGGFFSNVYSVDNWKANIISAIGSSYCDGDGDGVLDCTLGATATIDTIPPTIPTGLSALATGNQVTLSWTASTDASGSVIYIIERALGAGPFVPLSTPSFVNSFVDTGLTYSTTYRYRVQARDANANIQITYTNTVTATTGLEPLPVVNSPTGLVATGGINQISLSWNAATGLATTINYQIYRGSKADMSDQSLLGSTVGTELVYTNTGLGNGATWYYRVQTTAQRSPTVTGTACCSNIAGATTNDIPNAPTSLTATTNLLLGAVQLSWVGSLGTIPGAFYVLQRSTTATFAIITTLANTLSNSFSDPGAGLIQNTRYYYRVFIDYLTGQTGSVGDDEVWPDTTPPSAPSGLTLTPQLVGGVSSINVNFSVMSTDNISPSTGINYYIERSLTSSFAPFTTLGPTLDTCKNCWTDTAITSGTEYFYRVYAEDQAGNHSAYSEVKSAFPLFVGAVAPILDSVTLTTFGNRNVIFKQPPGGTVLPTRFFIEHQDPATGVWVGTQSITPASVVENVSITYLATLALPLKDVTYNYRVRGLYSGSLYTNWSNIVGFYNPNLIAGQPSLPINLNITVSGRQVTFTWDPSVSPNGIIDHYTVFIAPTTGSTFWTLIGRPVTNSYIYNLPTSYTDTTIAFYVYATDINGTWSGESVKYQTTLN